MALPLRTQKLIIVLVIIVVLALAIIFIPGQLQRVVGQHRQMAAADQERQNLQQEIDDLQKLQAELDESSAEIESMRKALPEGLSIPELLTNMEAIAVRSEMTFSSVSVGTEQAVTKSNAATAPTGTSVQELPLIVSVSGGYRNLKVYLDSLERNLRLIDVQSINMEAEGTYTITLLAYYVE